MCRAAVTQVGNTDAARLLIVNRDFTHLELWDLAGPRRLGQAAVAPIGSFANEPVVALLEGATRVAGIGRDAGSAETVFVIATVDPATPTTGAQLRPIIVDGVQMPQAQDAAEAHPILGTVVRAISVDGHSLASQLFPGRIFRHAGGDAVYEVRETDEGIQQVAVFRIRLQQAGGSE